MKNEYPKTLKNGKWVNAQEVPYYPNIVEKIGHLLGKHYYYQADHCLLCNLSANKKINTIVKSVKKV